MLITKSFWGRILNTNHFQIISLKLECIENIMILEPTEAHKILLKSVWNISFNCPIISTFCIQNDSQTIITCARISESLDNWWEIFW